MMNWLELASPSLRAHHNNWCQLRGPKKVAHIIDFGTFMKSVPANFAATVHVSEKRECAFQSVGENLAALYPGCYDGTKLSELTPLPVRLAISRSLLEVVTSRQPV